MKTISSVITPDGSRTRIGERRRGTGGSVSPAPAPRRRRSRRHSLEEGVAQSGDRRSAGRCPTAHNPGPGSSLAVLINTFSRCCLRVTKNRGGVRRRTRTRPCHSINIPPEKPFVNHGAKFFSATLSPRYVPMVLIVLMVLPPPVLMSEVCAPRQRRTPLFHKAQTHI